MEYFEQIRLLFILFMAYLSYRNLSSVNSQGGTYYAIQSEEEDEELQQENSLIEEENDVVINIQTVLQPTATNDAQSVANALQCASNQSDNIQTNQSVPIVQISKNVQISQRILCSIDENEVIDSKISKTKTIKKYWRKEKKQSNTQTIIGSDNNEQEIEQEPPIVIDIV